MARSKEDIYKKFGKDSIFVMGKNTHDRAKILYISGGLTPANIRKRLKEWGDDEILPRTLSTWIEEGEWKKLRKKYRITFDTKKIEIIAEQQAEVSTISQQAVRDVYAQVSSELMKMLIQKLEYNKPKYANAAIVKPIEIMQLSIAMKNLADVHFKAVGIPDTIIIDPTANNEGIRIMTKQDAERLESKSDE